MSVTSTSFMTRPGIGAMVLGGCAGIEERLVAAGMSPEAAMEKGRMFGKVAERLGGEAVAIWVPGRIEVLGKHTDYCGGRSLVCAVERGFAVVVRRREDDQVRLEAVGGEGTGVQSAQFQIQAGAAIPQRDWTLYPRTVANRVAANFGGTVSGGLRGCDVAFMSDLPQAAGLSSSSALVVAMFLALSVANDLEATPAYRENLATIEDLANYLGCVENGSTFRGLTGAGGVGTFGGSQDHVAILCSKPGKVLRVSFGPVRREEEIALPEDTVFEVRPSGVVAEKTGSAMEKYNAVSLRARKLAELGGVSVLNDAVKDGAKLSRLRDLVKGNEALTARLEQFVEEATVLIPAAADAMKAGDWQRFGELVDRSQRLSETHLGNQVEETVRIQRRLRAEGALAASAFGAGFGGSVWGLWRRGK